LRFGQRWGEPVAVDATVAGGEYDADFVSGSGNNGGAGLVGARVYIWNSTGDGVVCEDVAEFEDSQYGTGDEPADYVSGRAWE